jgi:hypothetical protein
VVEGVSFYVGVGRRITAVTIRLKLVLVWHTIRMNAVLVSHAIAGHPMLYPSVRLPICLSVAAL